MLALLGTLIPASAAHGTMNEVTELKLPKAQVQNAFQPRRLFLLVGVKNFTDARFHALTYPEKDVQDLLAFLTTHNHSPKDEQLVLTGDAATTTGLMTALDALERQNTSPDDIVLIYFSTHGTLGYENAHKLQRYAVMHDTDFDRLPDTGISLEYLQERLARLKSDRKAMILALCHSGSGKSALPDNLRHELQTMKADFFPQPLYTVSSAAMVLSASGWGQAAREDDTLKNDIYTHFLIDGLATNDANGDGAVSLFEAHEYARSKTYDYTHGQQTPTALVNIEGTDPIILNGSVKQRTSPMVFADSDQFRGAELLVNGEKKGTLWQPQHVPSGRVRLTLLDPRSPETPLMDHSLYLEKNQAYAVSTLFAREPTWSGELRAYALPIPAGIDGLSRGGTWAPGVVLRASEILGSRVNAGIGYFNRSWTGATAIDGIASDVTSQASCLQATGGLDFFPAHNLGLSVGAGVESLELTRTLANASVEHATQHAVAVYPVVVGDVRIMHLYGPIYAGVGASVVPGTRFGLLVDGQLKRVSPVSSTGIFGFNF